VARRVFFHIGLPKTGTTYLQTMMWHNRAELARQGVLLPGESSRQHLWASGVVREDPHLARRSPEAEHAWDLLVQQINAWDGTAIVSHEFFAAASAEQAVRAAGALGGAEVHVVVTARELLSLVTARWQEFVKNGSTVPIDDYPVSERPGPTDDWGWSTLDLSDVLGRWGAWLPHERVHVLTLPRPDEPRETLWLRFCDLVGIDPTTCESTDEGHNESLGVVQVELLRRVNAKLTGFGAPVDRGNWIRGYLAQDKLVPRGGERFWPSEDRVVELCERGNRIADDITAAGYDVIGDVQVLRPPAEVPERRHPDSVTDAEALDAAATLVADMLTDVRMLTRQGRAQRERIERLQQRSSSLSSRLRPARRLVAWVRALWPGSQRDDR
jgi:hypothetical protein